MDQLVKRGRIEGRTRLEGLERRHANEVFRGDVARLARRLPGNRRQSSG